MAELFPEVFALLRLCCHRSAGSRRRVASTAMTQFSDLTPPSQRYSMPLLITNLTSGTELSD